MKCLKGLCLLLPVILISASSHAQLPISPDLALEEYNLGGKILSINTIEDPLSGGLSPIDCSAEFGYILSRRRGIIRWD